VLLEEQEYGSGTGPFVVFGIPRPAGGKAQSPPAGHPPRGKGREERPPPSAPPKAQTPPPEVRGRRKRIPDCAEDSESGHPAMGEEGIERER